MNVAHIGKCATTSVRARTTAAAATRGASNNLFGIQASHFFAIALTVIAIICSLPAMANAYENMQPKSSPVDGSAQNAASPHKSKVGSVEQMLQGLKAKLEQKPDDVKGWVLLARSYHHIGDWHEAEKAASRARALGYEGDIFPGEKNQAVTSAKKAQPKMPNDHHHRGLSNNDAGAYVSSYFESLEATGTDQLASPTQKNSAQQPPLSKTPAKKDY